MGRRCSSPPAWRRRPRSSSRCPARARRSRSARAATTARRGSSGCSSPWGVRFVEYDQAGPAAARRRPRLDRDPRQPAPDRPRPRGRRGPPGACRLRHDRGDADPLPAARARRRRRAPLRDEVPRRPPRRAARRARLRATPASTIGVKAVRMQTGAIASPDSAWLLLRSLKTLELRVQRQSDDGARARAPPRRPPDVSRSSAIRASAPIRSPRATCKGASAACSPSTWPMRTRPGGSSPRRA